MTSERDLETDANTARFNRLKTSNRGSKPIALYRNDFETRSATSLTRSVRTEPNGCNGTSGGECQAGPHKFTGRTDAGQFDVMPMACT